MNRKKLDNAVNQLSIILNKRGKKNKDKIKTVYNKKPSL